MRKVRWLVAAGLLSMTTGCAAASGYPGGGYYYGSNSYYGQPGYGSGGPFGGVFNQPTYYTSRQNG